jgi:hypothetical protein
MIVEKLHFPSSSKISIFSPTGQTSGSNFILMKNSNANGIIGFLIVYEKYSDSVNRGSTVFFAGSASIFQNSRAPLLKRG